MQALAPPHSRRRPPRGAGVSSARFFLGQDEFITQVHGGTRRCASPFCLPSFSMLRQALQNGASDAPGAFCGRTRRPHRRRPRCGWRQWNSIFELDMVPPPHTRHIRHPRYPGTRRARATRSGVPGPCAFTSGGSPSPGKKSGAHGVTPKIKEQPSLSIQPETR